MAVHQSRVLKDYLYTFVAWFFNGFASLLPRKSSMLIGIVIGELIAIFSKRDRERAINNIQYSLHVGRDESKKIAKLCYQNVGKNLVEFLQFSGRLKKWIHHEVAIEGKVYIDRALDEGKGAIGVSAHLGNWELLPVSLAAHGYSFLIVLFIRRMVLLLLRSKQELQFCQCLSFAKQTTSIGW